MKTRKLVLFYYLMVCGLGLAVAQPTIHTIGDSTMEQKDTDSISNPNGQRGWPQMLSQFVTNGAVVNNRAKSGTSSKTFYEGKDSNGNYRFWFTVTPQIKEGDYVIIQFGHNDEKDGGWQSDHDGLTYTGIGTNPWEQYTQYLIKYVNEVRNLGAIPILFTPIVRNGFSGSSMSATACHNIGTDSIGRTLDYPAAMCKVADNLHVAMVDHTLLTKAYCESIGASQTSTLIYNVGDGTHLGIFGATTYARLAVKELIRQGILTDYLNANPDLLISSSELKFGKCYANASSIYQLSISGTDLTPAEGSVQVTAPEGYFLSTSQTGNYSAALTLNYTLGTLNLMNVYVKFNPSVVGTYNDSISFIYGAKSKKVSVQGQCVSLEGGQNASAYWELIANPDAVVQGPISIIPESYSEMGLQNYAAPNATTIWDGGSIVNGTKTQRNVIEGSAWPAGDIDIVNDRYIQFGVSSIKGTTFDIDSIGLYVGGAGGSGMRFKIYISKDSLFSDPETTVMIADRGTIANAANTMYPFGFNKLTELNSEESLYVRIFPWYNNAATGKTICLYGLIIKGVVLVDGSNGLTDAELSSTCFRCYPAVASEHTTITYKLKEAGDVRLDIRTVEGKKLYSRSNLHLPSGEYTSEVDLGSFPAGVLLCSILLGNESRTIRLIKK